MRILLLCSLVVFLFTSCEKETLVLDDPVQEPLVGESSVTFPGVDEALWPYFARFEVEAAKRGISVDLRSRKILGAIASIDDDGVAGTCHYDSSRPNEVTIDRGFWNSANDYYREVVVFHELGHCELIRDHREAQSANGICLSIMASGVGSCRLNYGTGSRVEYLDELFDVAFAGDWF